jgi:spermidine/putrescine transport system ATP-binding protein
MQGGRILQLGTPQEIYERPASRFVAEFIGDTNVLAAEPIGAGRFRLTGGADGPMDGRVTVAIRPERLVLMPPGEAALAGTVEPGTVEQVVYLGTDTTYHVRLIDGATVRVRVQNRTGAAPLARPGEDVSVHVPDDAAHVVEG